MDIIGKQFTKIVDDHQNRTKSPQVNPYRRICNYITDSSGLPKPMGKLTDKNKKSIRLAFISLASPCKFVNMEYRHYSQGANLSGINDHVLTRATKYLPDNKEKHLFKIYQDALNEAVSKAPDIIVANEFGFPATTEGPMPEAEEFTQELVKQKECLIIAGSYHDRRTLSNSGKIYYPSDGNEITVKTLAYHKQVSSVASEEYICVPPIRKNITVAAYGLIISVVICLDILDYSVITSLINRRNPPNFLFVPAYTFNDDSMKNVARTISKVTPAAVAIINSYIPGESNSHFYIFGTQISDGKLNSIVKHYSNRPLKRPNYVLDIYDINSSAFEIELKSVRNNPNKELNFLYGISDLIAMKTE